LEGKSAHERDAGNGINHVEERYNAQLWDTQGMERFDCLSASYYRSTDAFAIMFDVTDRESFLSTVLYWKKELLLKANLFSSGNSDQNTMKSVVLIGTKSDLAGKNSPFYSQYEPLPDIHTLISAGKDEEALGLLAFDDALSSTPQFKFSKQLRILQKKGYALHYPSKAAITPEQFRYGQRTSGQFTLGQLRRLLAMAEGNVGKVVKWLNQVSSQVGLCCINDMHILGPNMHGVC
jgi:hypothetical protein